MKYANSVIGFRVLKFFFEDMTRRATSAEIAKEVGHTQVATNRELARLEALNILRSRKFKNGRIYVLDDKFRAQTEMQWLAAKPYM